MQDTNKYKVYKAITAVGKWLLFAIVSFLILFPVLWIFVSSITPPGELFKMPIDYIPDHPTLESYKFLIENVGLLEKIGNTVLIVGVTIVVSTVICAMAAYGFSRFRTKGISIAFAFIIATMLIPEVVTARPLYDFMRAVGLYDTYPGLIILYISAVIPFTVLILKNFASEIPISLEEAATIDGANFVQRLFKVVLPLMKPAIAMENAFYNKENLNPDIHGASGIQNNNNNNMISVPEGVDADMLMKVLGNPEMAALLTSLAKSMKG